MFSYTEREQRQATLDCPPSHSISSYQHYSDHPAAYDTSQHHQIPSSPSRPYHLPSSLQLSDTTNPYTGENSGWFPPRSSINDHTPRTAFDPTPSPIFVPPIPAAMQDMLSDQYIAEQPTWGPFVPTQTLSAAAETYSGPNVPVHPSRENTQSPWSLHQQLSAAHMQYNQSSGAHFGGSANHIFPNDHNSHTPSYPSYLQPPSYDGSVGIFSGDRKGKERANGDEDFVKDLKRSRADAHNEFDKDIALLQTYLSDLIGLLQPFATSPSQPNPPKPPPYLHTRFLRLTSAVQQTLINLAPASHPFLASSSPHAPSKSKGHRTDAQSTAEMEMDLIRKRRDWLIAKAAQAKAMNPPMPTPGYSSGAGSPSHDAGPPQVYHPPGGYHGLDGDGHSSFGYGAGMTPGGHSESASLAYERNHPGQMTGRTLENPSGRCHSCGIQGAIEWRRGPDGARTLCDACGEHYAKLSRRRPSPSPPPLPPIIHRPHLHQHGTEEQ